MDKSIEIKDEASASRKIRIGLAVLLTISYSFLIYEHIVENKNIYLTIVLIVLLIIIVCSLIFLLFFTSGKGVILIDDIKKVDKFRFFYFDYNYIKLSDNKYRFINFRKNSKEFNHLIKSLEKSGVHSNIECIG